MNFGIDVINQIRNENPHLWTKAFQDEIRDMIRGRRRAGGILWARYDAARFPWP